MLKTFRGLLKFLCPLRTMKIRVATIVRISPAVMATSCPPPGARGLDRVIRMRSWTHHAPPNVAVAFRVEVGAIRIVVIVFNLIGVNLVGIEMPVAEAVFCR
jgi:hypothetical protein